MPELFRLPAVERAGRCYVRTRRDILLAVLRKEDLLACKDDTDLRNLKASARPVGIKVGD